MAGDRDIYTVKAFTDDPAGGNAAAVVPDATGLSEAQMQAIARVMGFSGTGFVLPSDDSMVEFRLRWFTPTVEVPLCGHATVATLKVLAELGRLPLDGSPRKIETLSGVLRITVEKDRQRQLHRLQVPRPEFRPFRLPEEKAKALYGVYQSDRMSIWPIVATEYDPYIPVISIGTLSKLRPDLARMKSEPGWGTACFFTGETLELGHTWHCRFFAPALGINEDPVTGAINGPLGAYFYQFVDTAKPPRAEYVGEQGDLINCPGRVYVVVTGDGAVPTDVEIGGEAVILKNEPLEDLLRRIGTI
jgi:trans-2,3-dihydro-3-hydroxyanthranilate isomerase